MISVCIATYNGEKYIEEQISSILHQLSPTDEIIISDDNSSDRTAQIIQEMQDNRIKFITNKKQQVRNNFYAVSLNFENAIKHSKGEFIFLADQDDLWSDNKISVCLEYLKKFDLLLHDCQIIDRENNIMVDSYFKLNKSRPGIISNLLKNSYLGCCMAFNRKILLDAMPIPCEIPHDIWFGLVAEKKHTVFFIKKALVKYRRHGSNLSPSGEKSSNPFIFKIMYRWKILTKLLKV